MPASSIPIRREALLAANERIEGEWTDEEMWANLRRERRTRGAASDQ
jgi:hypothetical protein